MWVTMSLFKQIPGQKLSIKNILIFWISCSFPYLALAGTVDPGLAARIKRDKTAKYVQVLLELDSAGVERDAIASVSTLPRKERPSALALLLKEQARLPHERINKLVSDLGGHDIQSLWLANKIAANMPIDMVNRVSQISGIKRVYSDAILQAPTDRLAIYRPSGTMRRDKLLGRERIIEPPVEIDAVTESVEKIAIAEHIVAMNVPKAWQDGYLGQGVTVAILDTGLDPKRAGLADALANGRLSWFDPYQQRKNPTDTHGHGTYVASLIAESKLFNRAIAVAPDAKIIVARIFNDEGIGRVSAVHRSFEWLLDPDGDPATHDSPDIVNNAWGLGNTIGRCDLEFAEVIALFRAAGIHMVFAAGNDGPSAGTGLSPANNPGVISVGGLNADGQSIWSKSGRGPSVCESVKVFPTILAPAQNIEVMDRIGLAVDEPAKVQGTSFATALVSGMLAVLRSQHPNASLDEIEDWLTTSSEKQIDGIAVVGYPGPNLVGTVREYKSSRSDNGDANFVARDLSFISVKHQPITVNVLSHFDNQGADLVVESVSKPAYGGYAKINVDGTITFTPREKFSGRDYFTYILKKADGSISRRAVINVLVQK
jgi:serine protease AprX